MQNLGMLNITNLQQRFQRLFEFERVKVKFTPGALNAIAKESIKRKSGARGLRAILEDVMLDLMYEIPSQTNIKEVVINEECIFKKQEPVIVYEKKAESA